MESWRYAAADLLQGLHDIADHYNFEGILEARIGVHVELIEGVWRGGCRASY